MGRRRSYLDYYRAYTSRAGLRFLWDGLFQRSRLRRLSLANRQRDYLALAERPELMALHHRLHEVLERGLREWDSYDYGEGYFYQGFDAIHLTGVRDTAARIEAMDLRERVAGRSVLEIGCNTGFLSLSIADRVPRLLGFDLNPFLVEIARRTAEHLGVENAEFRASSFEALEPGERFDAVLSFANHKTYDGNTRASLEEFFDKCRALTAPGGLLIFESHPPELEGEGLERVCELIGERFAIQERRVLDYGTFLDRGRTFVVARNEGA